MDSRERSSDRGQSAVLGELLMVGVVVVIAAGLAVGAFLLAGTQPTIQAETVVDVEETSAGTTLEVQRVGQSAEVRIEGDTVATLNESDAGRSVYLPTAPGDEVTVVASEGDQSLLLSETVDRGEAGDFIAYYTFDAGSGSTVRDRSTNDNDGTINGAPAWSDTCGGSLEFDGANDYVRVPDITTTNVSDVEAFTVAVEFRSDGETGDIQQLVEHTAPDGSEWFLETSGSTAPFDLSYAVNYPSDTVATSGQPLGLGETHVAVATYDGETYELYLDGSLVASANYASEVEMGRLTLARDDESNIQHLDGALCEMRLYYTAFDADEVATMTERVGSD